MNLFLILFFIGILGFVLNRLTLSKCLISILVSLLVVIAFKLPLFNLGVILSMPLFMYLGAGLTGGLIYVIRLYLSDEGNNLSFIGLALAVGLPVFFVIVSIPFLSYIHHIHELLIGSAVIIGQEIGYLMDISSILNPVGPTNQPVAPASGPSASGPSASVPPTAVAPVTISDSDVVVRGPGFTVTRGDLLRQQATLLEGANNILLTNPKIDRITVYQANEKSSNPIDLSDHHKLLYVFKERGVYKGSKSHNDLRLSDISAWTVSKKFKNINAIIE